ncbi:jupiter microtubule associated homolog 1 [Etheostoma spectabile]|uniref:jupiter microtubule associated homolog 1 n=1 Tax=Etheostoma spectabile TaxID=54343 RepID=UPI0013AF1EB2|nr:jupiter microtubule associated homolog 1 [Etheostoma spectabile]
MGLVGWHRRTHGSGLRYVQSVSGGVFIPSELCGEGGGLFLLVSHCVFVIAEASKYSIKMTTTTTYKGMEPGSKSSSRVLRPPGGTSSISFGTDDNSTPRKDKMASNIFAEPEDPHAHRRNNPPTGAAAGTICGEPSAPLRRCQQPLLFPKNPEPELTTIHNSGAALVWNQRREVVNGQEPANDECPNNVEVEQEEPEQHKETTEPAAPSGGANAAAGSRRNPPGGKSSLILG